MPNRYVISLALALAALAWPSLYVFASALAASPLERALNLARCGELHGSAFIGHCLTCWSGAAVLLAASGLVLKGKKGLLAQA
ncbi:MAG: hypothetical protein ABL883_15255 [Terricaulis sp.]